MEGLASSKQVKSKAAERFFVATLLRMTTGCVTIEKIQTDPLRAI